MKARLAISLVTAVLCACGGGGGGGGPNSGAVFSMSTARVSFAGTAGQTRPSSKSVTGTVTGADSPVFVVVTLSRPGPLDDAFVSISGESGVLTLVPRHPSDLGAGEHTDTVTVSICNDQACRSHLRGSPRSIPVRYTVNPDPDRIDSDNDGVPDVDDAFPNDSSEQTDTDGDGQGNNADPDDDGDGVADSEDEFPQNEALSYRETTVNIAVGGQGSLQRDGATLDCDTSCSFTIDNTQATSTRMQALADTHFSFTSWGDDSPCADAGDSCTLHTGQTPSVQLNVAFTEDPNMRIELQLSAGGSVVERFGSVACTESCQTRRYEDQRDFVELYPVPRPGQAFTGWTGACAGSGDSCRIDFVTDTDVSAGLQFAPTAQRFDLCPGLATATFSGAGTDANDGINDFLALCNGTVIMADGIGNRIVVRDVVNAQTSQTHALPAEPRTMALDEENGLLWVTHGQTSYVSRVDLATDTVTPVFFSGGAESVAVSATGDVLVRRDNALSVRVIDSATAMLVTEQPVTGGAVSYNDATSRLITSSNNYFFDADTHTLTLQGRSAGGGSGSDCDSVAVSPDGIHAAKPCGGGNGDGYTVFDFDSSDPSIVFGEWDTGAFPSGVAFAPSSRYVLLTDRRNLQMFDVDTHQLVTSVPATGCSNVDVRRLAISTDGKLGFGLAQCGFRNAEGAMNWFAFDSN